MEGDRNPATTKRKLGEDDSVSSSDDDLPVLSKRAKRLAEKRSSTDDRNPTTSIWKFSDVSESSSDDDLRQSKRKKSLSSTNDRDPGTSKRKFSEVSVCSSDDDLRRSKRLARASSATIHDIPEELLVEILCRLPCVKAVFRCKSVSKSWRSLTSDPNFVGRFLWLQRQNQTIIPGTIINKWGSELLTTDLFATFRSFKTKKIERLKVLATWNDLVLCKRRGVEDNGEYYICNPRTMQLVSLPPTDRCSWCSVPAVGFMCEPYYKEEEDDRHTDNSTDHQKGEKRKVIRIDAEYKCKVVRILAPEDQKNLCFEFKIQVFSNDIGEWRESLVSCPRGFIFSKLPSDPLASTGAFASNGMLYWNATNGDLLGLGPLMINNKSTSSCSSSTAADGDSRYQFHVIKLVERQENEDEDERSSLYHLQAHRGRLQLMRMVGNEDGIGARLFVWELEKEEQEQMAVQGGGELGQKHRNIYSLMDGVRCYRYTSEYNSLEYFGSDPNDLDTCFVSLTDYTFPKKKKADDDDDDYTVIYKCNIHTGECSEMDMDEPFSGKALQIMLPWWPTPVPTIRSHTAAGDLQRARNSVEQFPFARYLIVNTYQHRRYQTENKSGKLI